MIHVILGVVGCFMGVFGVLSNLYILVILLWNKKTRTSSEWILLHLSWCGFGASLFHLCFLTPSIFSQRFILASSVLPICGISGCGLLILQLVTIWSVCALSADRAIAIVYPLRYSQIATSQRIAAYFLVVWLISTAVMISSLFFSSFQELHHNHQLREWSSTTTTNDNLHFNKHLNASLFESSRSGSSRSGASNVSSDTFMFNATAANNVTAWGDETNLTMYNNSQVDQQQQVSRSGSSSSLPFLVPAPINSKYPSSSSGSSNSANVRLGESVVVAGGSGEVEEDSSGMFLPAVSQTPLLFDKQLIYELRPVIGVCLPKAYGLSWAGLVWTTEYLILVLIAPMAILLICDLAVLSIARRQSHRILLAMTMVTITAQATVTRSKGMAPAPPTGLFINNVPARSRACRAVAEDMTTMVILHCPILLMLVTEMIFKRNAAAEYLMILGSVSIFATPCCNAILYGIRARPLRAAYKSYLRIRLTNTTLENEIQNRLSPVDGSPRPSSRARSFRSASPSPSSSPIHTPPRRLSTNDLRPPGPGNQLLLTSSPSQDNMGRKRCPKAYYEDDASVSSLSRKVRSFLHIPSFPSQMDMQDFWSGLRRPNRGTTIHCCLDTHMNGPHYDETAIDEQHSTRKNRHVAFPQHWSATLENAFTSQHQQQLR